VLAIGREQRATRREILEALASAGIALPASAIKKTSNAEPSAAEGVGIGQQAAAKPPQLMAVPTAPPAPDSGPREALESGPDAGAGAAAASSAEGHSPEAMSAVLQKMEALAAEVASLRLETYVGMGGDGVGWGGGGGAASARERERVRLLIAHARFHALDPPLLARVPSKLRGDSF
jgi:hypothetical protein